MEHDVLYTELIRPADLQQGQKLNIAQIEKLTPIRKLSAKVMSLEKDCGNALLELARETKEMIELVSIWV